MSSATDQDRYEQAINLLRASTAGDADLVHALVDMIPAITRLQRVRARVEKEVGPGIVPTAKVPTAVPECLNHWDANLQADRSCHVCPMSSSCFPNGVI